MIETHLDLGRQSVKLALIAVMEELFPEDRLKTAYSIQEGVFCRLNETVMSVREVEAVGRRLREWIAQPPAIRPLGQEGGYHIYEAGERKIAMLYPCDPTLKAIPPYTIAPFGQGFIVDFEATGAGMVHPPYKLSKTYHKTQKWLRKLDLELIGDVNAMIREGRHNQLISLAEALHEKEIAEIAEAIVAQSRNLRVLLIAGPSSSGKTSFAQRLSTQLRVSGLKPVPISLDDYFRDEGDKPLAADGTPDWESIHALDLNHLRHQVEALIRGEEIQAPLYSFQLNRRREETRPLSLGEDEILVIEGIHALNPELLPNISRALVYKIYITALFELNIDLSNRIPGSEIRLLRRLVRDDRHRGTDPLETLNMWSGVRRGELVNIFRFQEECDVMFNSSLIYEMNALRALGEKTLEKIPEDSQYGWVRKRLLSLLSFCEPLEVEKIPYNSLIREFIGGSIYFPD